MTEHEIDNMQPGPELDRLVAEACGIDPYEAKLKGFMPSTDWNDAMLAAGKAQLFCLMLFLDQDAVGNWAVCDLGSDCKRIAHDKSGPLAICRAILQSKQDDT